MAKSDDFIKKYLGASAATGQPSSLQPTSPASDGSAADSFIKKYYVPVDDAYISSFVSDWSNYAKDAQTTYEGLNWETATTGDFSRYDDIEKDLSSRAAAIRSFFTAHQGNYDAETYSSILKELDEMTDFQNRFKSGRSDAKKYYSQWSTEDEYKNAIIQKQQEEAGKIFAADANAFVSGNQSPEISPIVSQTGSPVSASSIVGEKGYRKYDDRKIQEDTQAAIDRRREDAVQAGSFEALLAADQERNKALQQAQRGAGLFQSGALSDPWKAFDDGWQKGDVIATIADLAADGSEALLATALDAIARGEKGVMRVSENIADALGHGFADVLDLFGAHDYADEVRKNADENTTDEIFRADDEYYAQNSVLGQVSADVLEGVANAAALGSVGAATGGGTLGATLGTSAATFLSSYGSGIGEARQAGADDLQAAMYALGSAAADTTSELIFGGLGKAVNAIGFSKGLSSLDDMLAKAATKGIKNQVAKNIVQYGIKSGAEGLEEVLAGVAKAWVKSDTYMSDEDFLDILADEKLLYQFMTASLTSGIMQAPGFVSSTAANTDFVAEDTGGAKPSAPTSSGAVADAPANTAQTPQSAHTAENLSGITQDGNAAIPGTAGQETADGESRAPADDFIMAEDYDHQTINTPAYRLNEYTQHQKDNWANSKRIVLFEGVQQFRRFIQNALSGAKQTNKKMYFGMVSADLAAEIKAETGIDVEGYNLSLGENEIRKINKSHGNESTETTRGQRAVTEADYLNIPDVVQSPDAISLSSKTYEGKPVIEFRQYNGNETTVVAAVVSDRRLDLFVQTTFINKKTGSIATPESVQADSFTPKATGGTAPTNSISKNAEDVNPDVTSPENSTTSVGAAPAGFDPLTHAMVQYGNIPEGENAVRDDSLPVSMDGESKVSRVARTALGAEATPDAYAEDIRKEVADGNLSYIPITNDATVQKVEKHIRELGWQRAYTEWVANVEKGITGAEMTATGAVLLNNAANAGDHESWRDVLYHFQKLGTNTAQGLQAFRILKTLSPSDKLWMIKESAQQMVDDLGIDVEITLDETLVDEYDNAKTDEQREAALDKIVKSVAEQIPPKFMEKVNSWRYLNMLGNLRTQIRNLTGNVSMAAVTSVKDTVATALERIVHFVSGGKTELTKSFTVSREMMQAGKDDFANVESIVNSGGRYSLHDSETSDIKQRIQDARTIFRFKPLEGYRKLTNWAMDKGDVLFSKPAYARALAGYLKAHGVTDADFSKVDTELMDNARLYAVKQAQEQTFRDTNALSAWVSQIGRGPKTPKWLKPAVEGVLPFRKTPANIAVRAWEYSPLGVINAVVNSVNAARSGSDTTAADAINSWAKTLTGGGLIGLGMLLQTLGLIRGTEDDDEQRAFDSLNGWQEYSLVLPNGTNLTIDALSPAALPLLVGAQMKAVIDGEEFSLDQVLGAMSALADPMVDMSLMSGIKSLIEDIRYSEEPLGQIAVNTLIDYATQIVTNSWVGQLERSTEKQRMQTYVDPDSAVPDWIQKALGGISAKTPGWDYQQIPYINAWGEKEETPAGLNLLENTVSPFYFDKGEKTPLTEELNRLYNDAQETGVYPSRPDKKQTYTDENGFKHKGYGLDAQEYVEFATVQGQTQKRILDEMISSEAYQSLPDSYKAEAIEEAYWCANRQARFEVLSDNDEEYHKWISRCWGTEAEFILGRIHLRYLTDQVIPEEGYKSARQVQIVEQIASTDDGYTESDQEKMLWEALSEAKLKTYNKVKGMGYDIDDFATVYRIYQKADDSKTYNKEHAIRDIARTLGVSEATATTLYEAY